MLNRALKEALTGLETAFHDQKEFGKVESAIPFSREVGITARENCEMWMRCMRDSRKVFSDRIPAENAINAWKIGITTRLDK